MTIPFVVTSAISDAFWFGFAAGLLISIVAVSAYQFGARGDKGE